MRKVKRKISYLLILVLLVNLLLPGMGAFAAESTNDFVVLGGNEQNLISLDASNWGDQTSTPGSNADANRQSDDNKEEAIGNQILDSNNEAMENDIEIQAIQIPAIVVAALAYVAKKLSVKVFKKVWPIIKSKLTTVAKDIANKYNDLSVVGPGGGRVFKLVSKKYGEVFRFDIELLKRYDGYYIYPHYHSKPNLSKHNPLAPGDGYIYWGKDNPPGF